MAPISIARALALLSLSVGPLACSNGASVGDELASSEGEVRTAKCPGDVALEVAGLEMQTFFSELRHPDDYNPMKALAQAIDARGRVAFAGLLHTKKSGRCSYRGANGDEAVLYTKGGRNLLRIDLKIDGREVYVHTQPSACSPALRYAAGSEARLTTALGSAPADPMDDVDESEAPSPVWVTLGKGRVSAMR